MTLSEVIAQTVDLGCIDLNTVEQWARLYTVTKNAGDVLVAIDEARRQRARVAMPIEVTPNAPAAGKMVGGVWVGAVSATTIQQLRHKREGMASATTPPTTPTRRGAKARA